MAIEIHTKPDCISYEDFLAVDRDCFPNEPVTSRWAFEEMLDGFFLIACDGDVLVGFAHAQVSGGGHLKRIGVRTGYRRQGVGSALLEEVVHECRSHREGRLCLAVQADNTGAIALYEKAGFRTVGKAYQFRATFGDTDGERILAVVEACDLDPALQRAAGGTWAWLLRRHDPPHTLVLVFTDDNHEFSGICRLAPDFPGCKPFHIVHPERDVRAAVASLRKFVPRSHEHVLLTFSSEQLARACVETGFALNYELVNMARRLEGMV